jgi:hypothetical protein
MARKIQDVTGTSQERQDRAIKNANHAGGWNRLDQFQTILSKVMGDLVWIPLYFDQNGYAIDSSYIWKPRAAGGVFASEIELRTP